MERPLDDEGIEEELEGEWELDPNDPTHPDHDLSLAAGYAGWNPPPKPWYIRRGVMLVVIGLVICAIILVPLMQVI